MKSKFLIIGLTLFFLLSFVPLQFCMGQTATVSILPSQNTVNVGDTLKINVAANNVENLYGLDVTVNWSQTALLLVSTTNLLGVESHPSGVLHETVAHPIQVVEDNSSQSTGSYHLVATSVGDAAPFSGSGTIASLTFIVTSTGQSKIGVVSELADHPDVGDTTSEPIPHNDIAADIFSSSSTGPSPTIPELPQMTLIAAVASAMLIALLFRKSLSKKKP